MTPSDPSSPSFSKDAVDPIVHSPARLQILAVLSAVESADFIFIRRQTHLTKGNLSSHMSKLEEAGYITVKKEFVGKIPRTVLRLTSDGRTALEAYRKHMTAMLNQIKDT